MYKFFDRVKYISSRKYNRLKRKVLLKKPYTDEQLEIFNKVEIGNIIFAEMPFNDSTLYDIPDGHRNRPYIVVRKEENYVLCYASSHKLPKGIPHKYIYKFNKEHIPITFVDGEQYQTWTDSYYNLRDVFKIPIENIIEIFQIPKKIELELFERNLVIVKNKRNNTELLGIKFNLFEGDIIRINNRYFMVYSSYGNEVYAHKIVNICKVKKEYVRVDYKKGFFVDFNNVTKVEEKDYYGLINSIPYELYNKFVYDKNELKHFIRENRRIVKSFKLNFKIGQIIIDVDKYIKYVYLYSIKNTMYGIILEEMEKIKKGLPNIVKIPNRKYIIEDKLDNEIISPIIYSYFSTEYKKREIYKLLLKILKYDYTEVKELPTEENENLGDVFND